jgi:hypothetical protein
LSIPDVAFVVLHYLASYDLGLTHGNKKHRYSVTSSARASSIGSAPRRIYQRGNARGVRDHFM